MVQSLSGDLHDSPTEVDVTAIDPRNRASREKVQPTHFEAAIYEKDTGNLPAQSGGSNTVTLLNELLTRPSFHIFVKIARVYVKVKTIAIDPHDSQYLVLTVVDDKQDIEINVPWNIEFSTYLGVRKFIW